MISLFIDWLKRKKNMQYSEQLKIRIDKIETEISNSKTKNLELKIMADLK